VRSGVWFSLGDLLLSLIIFRIWFRFTSTSTLFLVFFLIGLTELEANNSLKFDNVLAIGVFEVASIALLFTHSSDSIGIKFLGVSFLSTEEPTALDLIYYLVS
jgi:hypothetical protein